MKHWFCNVSHRDLDCSRSLCVSQATLCKKLMSVIWNHLFIFASALQYVIVSCNVSYLTVQRSGLGQFSHWFMHSIWLDLKHLVVLVKIVEFLNLELGSLGTISNKLSRQPYLGIFLNGAQDKVILFNLVLNTSAIRYYVYSYFVISCCYDETMNAS